MDGQSLWKFVNSFSIGIVAVIVGSLTIAAVIEDTDGGDTFVLAFVATLGSAAVLFGVAIAVASTTIYLVTHR